MSSLLIKLISNGLDTSKYPLIDWAIWNDFDDVLVVLLEAGFDPNKFLVANENYNSPVVYAAHFQKNSAVKTLHRYGADLDVVGKKGLTVRSLVEKAQ